VPRPRLDDALRAAILTDVQAGQLSRNAVARKHGVAASTVTKIANEAQLGSVFDRSQTEKGARAASIDAKALRAQLALDLTHDAQRLRERIWSEYTQVVPSPLGPSFVTTKLPPLRDQQAGYTAVAIAIDKALKLVDYDTDGGATAGRTMVNDLFGALKMAWHQIGQADDEPPPGAEPDGAE